MELITVEVYSKRGYNIFQAIIHAGVAELADALDLGSSGAYPWRFKSSRPHHFILKGFTTISPKITPHYLLPKRQFYAFNSMFLSLAEGSTSFKRTIHLQK